MLKDTKVIEEKFEDEKLNEEEEKREEQGKKWDRGELSHQWKISPGYLIAMHWAMWLGTMWITW